MSGLFGRTVAIANRAEIAVRIAATCRRLGATPVVLLGDPDLDGYAARSIGRVERLGPAGSELDTESVIAAARRIGADYLHPGYGFLSERAELAEACAAAGIVFVGPSAETLRLCGDKIATRSAAERAGAPLLPASTPLGDDPAAWLAAGRQVGFSLLVKPAEAGGGRGLRRVTSEAELVDAVAASKRESAASGAGERVYLERELRDARHVEVQVAADGRCAVALGDRDCSLQRRAQKVIEEAPAPGLDRELRSALHEHARRIAEEVGLVGIATCEFLLGGDGTLAFLEVNPRIQVEHPVTELVTGVDLVAWQLAIAVDHALPWTTAPEPRGHAVEARVYAEDPFNAMLPSVGPLGTVSWPRGPALRVDAGYERGDTVPPAYDAMLAKVIAHGSDRATALATLDQALRETVVTGVATNVPWLLALLERPEVREGGITVDLAETVTAERPDPRTALLAAVAHAVEGDRTDATDPWGAIGPFRVSGGAGLTFHGDDWETRVEVQGAGDAWHLSIDGRRERLRWWRGPDGTWTVAAGETVALVGILRRGDELEVAGAGGRWRVADGPRRVRREHGGASRIPADGTVRAPLPGKVLAVHVAPGSAVAAGQQAVTLTAMKMEIACVAPAEGRVIRVAVAVGDQVDAGAVLVALELSSEPDHASA